MAEGDPDDPVVRAATDQLKAQAIDWLREADTFAVFVPTELDGQQGLAFMFNGPFGFMVEMLNVLTEQIAAQAAKEFLENREDHVHTRDVLADFINILKDVKGGEDDTTGEEGTSLR